MASTSKHRCEPTHVRGIKKTESQKLGKYKPAIGPGPKLRKNMLAAAPRPRFDCGVVSEAISLSQRKGANGLQLVKTDCYSVFLTCLLPNSPKRSQRGLIRRTLSSPNRHNEFRAANTVLTTPRLKNLR